MDQNPPFDLIAAIDAKKHQKEGPDAEHKQYLELLETEFPRLLQEALLFVRSRLERSPNASFNERGSDRLIITVLDTQIRLEPIDPFKFGTGYRGKIPVFLNNSETGYSIVMVGPLLGPWSLKISRRTAQNKEPELLEFTQQNVDHMLGRLLNLIT